MFNTGDNEPRRRGVLRAAFEWLGDRGVAGYDRPIGDVGGTYAYRIRIQGKGLYLVARSRPPWRRDEVEYVSSQRVLVTQAADEKTVILVCIWVHLDKDPAWRVFDARELKQRYAETLLERDHDNMRKGSRMLNYEWALGVPLRNPARIWEILERIRVERRIRHLQVGLEQEWIQEKAEGLIECPGCSAVYSPCLEACPACGQGNPLKVESNMGHDGVEA